MSSTTQRKQVSVIARPVRDMSDTEVDDLSDRMREWLGDSAAEKVLTGINRLRGQQ